MELVIAKKDAVVSQVLEKVFLALFFVAAISLGAFVRVPLPFTPVPLTLQTFFVLLSAACLGLKWSVSVQVAYILLGVIGLPVFTGANAGVFYLTGPTAGYIFGFIVAAAFISLFLKSLGKNFILVVCLFCIADLFLLLCGALWLKISLRISLMHSFLIGLVPFIVGDIFKAFLSASLFWAIRPRIKSIQ